MSVDFQGAPAEVEGLYAELVRRGFEVVEDRRGGMGGLSLTLRGSVPVDGSDRPAEVQISADRGHWAVGVRFEDMSRFVDPGTWAAHLDGTETGESDLQAQVRFVTERLGDAAAAVAADPSIEAKLVRLGEAYMRERLGITDPTWPPKETRHW